MYRVSSARSLPSADGSQSSWPSGIARKILWSAPVIQHAALETRRADGAAGGPCWRLLGFVEVKPPPSLRERAAWLQRGSTQIHLLWSDKPVAPSEGHV